MKKSFTLCADDYAQSIAISKGIIDLIDQKRLSATSCLVNTPYWRDHAQWLQPYLGQIEIGLHFNLTMGKSLGRMPNLAKEKIFPHLSRLLFNSLLGNISQQEISDEFNRQLDEFEKYLGKPPDFIDGHQHIHCFSGIRQAILNTYEKRFPKKEVWIRNIFPGYWRRVFTSPAIHKKIILMLLGGYALKKSIKRNNIPHNESFAGIYRFSCKNNYDKLFPRFLKAIDKGGLIMCHPGLISDSETDSIAANRASEYAYFCSDIFLKIISSEFLLDQN